MKLRKQDPRRGLILICVIACLVVSSALIALTIQSSLRGRRESRIQLQLRQTELLCEAGVSRAAKQLEKSPAYLGEQWRPDLGLDNYHDAVVEIKVIDVDLDSRELNHSSKSVTVIAKLDSYLDQDGPMQRTHRFTVPLQTLSNLSEKQ